MGSRRQLESLQQNVRSRDTGAARLLCGRNKRHQNKGKAEGGIELKTELDGRRKRAI